MRTTELIATLQEMLERHGDLPVFVSCEAGNIYHHDFAIYRYLDGDEIVIDADGDLPCIRARQEHPDDRVAGPEDSRGED